MKQGYWINWKTGQIDDVGLLRHEQWLKDPDNIERFGLSSDLWKVVKDLKDPDEIRMAGLYAGLARVRNNRGTISIQFYAPRGKVSDALFNIVRALRKIGEYGTSAWVHNLMYDDSKSMPWSEFVRAVERGEKVLVMEGVDGPDDIQFTIEMLADRMDSETT